ncbi:MGTE1 [Auxenochlorella protothecoides x Auxenochlorella symbiontica]
MAHCTITSKNVSSPRALEIGWGEDRELKDDNYTKLSVIDLIRERWGWLLIFFGGLVLAALVVEAFEDVLKHNVELSYFVPLLIGHGGNTGSQSNATVIRALALGHVKPSDYLRVMAKEAGAGTFMGAMLGLMILGFSFLWDSISTQVGLVVAISLPLVSLWANVLGGVFPLLSARFGFNPAVTSAPLMTTVVDSSGLIIYFYIAKIVMKM